MLPSGGPKARVVVIDDEPLVGQAIRRTLRSHDVQVFTDGEAAIEAICDGSPIDVVFCDIMMPGLSGIEIFAEVSSRRPELAARFVFMTGGAFTPKAREFLQNTALACIEKPFSIEQIRKLVHERTSAAQS